MDAKKTGALIAERRKALGLTQKELAEQLLVSDKAVSKWETGAGYPEVTLLPLLAQALGITVDELLAGGVRADAPASDKADANPSEADGAPPGPSDIQRAYAAEKLADADDKLLLACCAGSLAFVWYAVSLGMQGIFRLLMICILFAACSVWHSSRIRQLCDYAAPDDLSVSRRRARLLQGSYTAIALLFGAAMIAPAFSEFLMFRCGRYEITFETEKFYWGLLLGLLLMLIAALGVLAFCCLKMTVQTRFHPVAPGVVSALPCLGAAVLLYLRGSLIVSFSPSSYERALVTVEKQLNPAMAQLVSGARTAWVICTVLLAVWCVVLRRIKRCSVPLILLLPCIVLQSLLWYVVGASDLFLMLEFPSVLSPSQRGEITILTAACFFMLLLSLLIWAICTLLSGVRRKPKQPAAPASGAQPYS